MEEDSQHHPNSIKIGIRACHKELVEISELLGNGDVASKNQAKLRMDNIKRLAESILAVLDKWDIELEKDRIDRQEFIDSVLTTIENIDSMPS